MMVRGWSPRRRCSGWFDFEESGGYEAGKAVFKPFCHKTQGTMFGISDHGFAQRGRSSVTLVRVVAVLGVKQGKKHQVKIYAYFGK